MKMNGTQDLARTLLEHSLSADPNQPESQFQMGVVMQDSSNWKGSIPYLERALKLKPDLAQAHYRCARLLENGAQAGGRRANGVTEEIRPQGTGRPESTPRRDYWPRLRFTDWRATENWIGHDLNC